MVERALNSAQMSSRYSLATGPASRHQVMQGLEFLERVYHIRLFGQQLGLLYEVAFDFQVFLEIEVAKLFVHLQAIENLLHYELIVFPTFVDCPGRNVGYGLEILLELTYLRDMEVYVVYVGCDSLELVNDLVLLRQVVDTPFLFGREPRVAHLAERGEQIFETDLIRVGGADKGVAGLCLFGKPDGFGLQLGIAQYIECLLDGRYLFVTVSFLCLDYGCQGLGEFTLGHFKILVPFVSFRSLGLFFWLF